MVCTPEAVVATLGCAALVRPKDGRTAPPDRKGEPMSEQQTPEMKNSDAPGDQDQAAQEKPVHAEGLAEKAKEAADDGEGGYNR